MRSRDYIKELRRLLWERDGKQCGICKKPLDLADVHIDHVEPIALGGSDTWENMRTAHRSCNSRKGIRSEPVSNPKHINVSLRLPEDLHDALVDLATRERRSMHAQLVYLVEQTTGKRDTVKRRTGRRRTTKGSSDAT